MLSAIKEKTYFGASADCAVFRETVLITVGGVGWGWVGCDYNNNNNNTLIYIAPACRMTSEALAESSSRATECLTEK